MRQFWKGVHFTVNRSMVIPFFSHSPCVENSFIVVAVVSELIPPARMNPQKRQTVDSIAQAHRRALWDVSDEGIGWLMCECTYIRMICDAIFLPDNLYIYIREVPSAASSLVLKSNGAWDLLPIRCQSSSKGPWHIRKLRMQAGYCKQ